MPPTAAVRLVLAACLVAAAAAPAAAQPATAPAPRSITVTAEGTTEEWQIRVEPLRPNGGQPPSHAVVFAAFVKACDTPRAFPIVFTVGGVPEVRKQGALLSREKQTDGSCLDAAATVFPVGTAPAFAGATTASIGLASRRLVLSASDIAYLAGAFADLPPPADTSSTAVLQNRTPWPEDPALRAAAQESDRLNEQAVQLLRAGRLKEARQASESALSVAEKAWGADHKEVAQLLVNLGLIVRKQGDNKAAETHYVRAVAILDQQPPSQSLGIVLDNLGRVQQDLRELDAAMATTRRAIDVLSAVLGAEHEHVGFATNNLALLLHEKGEHAQAADTCDRAIAILQKALGPDHPMLKPFLEDQRQLRKRAQR